MKDVLTLQQVADRYHVSTRTVRRWAVMPGFPKPFSKQGRAMLWSTESLLAHERDKQPGQIGPQKPPVSETRLAICGALGCGPDATDDMLLAGVQRLKDQRDAARQAWLVLTQRLQGLHSIFLHIKKIVNHVDEAEIVRRVIPVRKTIPNSKAVQSISSKRE